MSFQEKCVHCDHYHDHGVCCFCAKAFHSLKKSADDHRAELEELTKDEIEI